MYAAWEVTMPPNASHSIRNVLVMRVARGGLWENSAINIQVERRSQEYLLFGGCNGIILIALHWPGWVHLTAQSVAHEVRVKITFFYYLSNRMRVCMFTWGVTPWMPRIRCIFGKCVNLRSMRGIARPVAPLHTFVANNLLSKARWGKEIKVEKNTQHECNFL